MRSYRSKRMFFFGYVPSTPEECRKSNRFQLDDSRSVCVCKEWHFGHVSTNKENTENKSDERNGKKRKKRTFCMNKNGTVNVDIKFTI